MTIQTRRRRTLQSARAGGAPGTKRFRGATLLLAFGLLLALQGCSGPGVDGTAVAPAANPVSASAAAPAASPPQAPVPGGPDKACNRIAADRMSEILGTAMIAVAHDDTEGVTECSYSPSSGTGPSVEYMVMADDNGATIQMVSEMKNYDPASGKAFAGIGDRADVLGGAVLINDGSETVSLRMVGVDDQPAVAKKIFQAGRRAKSG